MRATIRQVAERAGVSRSTVSNVLLSRHGQTSDETKAAVLKAVRELDYVPVHPVLQNRAHKTHVISLVLNDANQFSYEFHGQNCAGVGKAALQNGYDLLTLVRPDPVWATDRREVGLLDRRSDGIIILSTETDEKIVFEALARREVPTVVCYRRDVPEGIVWADPNNQQIMFGAVAHLREHNHTRIAHLSMDSVIRFDYAERCRYFCEAVREYGVPQCAENIFTFSRTLLQDRKMPVEIAQQVLETGATAVVCANDWLSLLFWSALQEMGLEVPKDVSLIGVDNGQDAQARGLTTMGFSFTAVGAGAVAALLDRLAGRPIAECHREIEVQLHERNSVRRL